MKCSKPQVCEKLADCRCYAYSANKDRQICGVLVDGFIFPCRNPVCCPGGCPTPINEPLGYGEYIPDDFITDYTVLGWTMLVSILCSFIITSLKM